MQLLLREGLNKRQYVCCIKNFFPVTPLILFPGRNITPFSLFVSALRVLAPSTAVPELFLMQPNSKRSLCSQNPGRGEIELAA